MSKHINQSFKPFTVKRLQNISKQLPPNSTNSNKLSPNELYISYRCTYQTDYFPCCGAITLPAARPIALMKFFRRLCDALASCISISFVSLDEANPSRWGCFGLRHKRSCDMAMGQKEKPWSLGFLLVFLFYQRDPKGFLGTPFLTPSHMSFMVFKQEFF